MPTVLFFAQAREAAGTGTVYLDGNTLQAVLDIAVEKYGEAFGQVLAMSKVWVNGDEVPRDYPVSDKDEVAVLPPVSGGI